MKEQDLKNLINEEFQPFMSRFEQENRGNRISLELIQGTGTLFFNKILDIVLKIQEVQNADNRKS